MCDQQRLVLALNDRLGDDLRRGGVAPLDRETRQIGAVVLGDRRKAVAERAGP